MAPCPICGKKLKYREGKYLPLSEKCQALWCDALGLPRGTFSSIDTRRSVCLEHFGEEWYVTDSSGNRVLDRRALPKRLSDAELLAFPRLITPRYRSSKSSIVHRTSQSLPPFRPFDRQHSPSPPYPDIHVIDQDQHHLGSSYATIDDPESMDIEPFSPSADYGNY